MTTDHPVFALADRFVDGFARIRPLEATFAGIAGHDHRWGDLGPEGIDALEEHTRATRAELDRLPPAPDPDTALAVRTLGELCDEEIARIEHGDAERDLAHLGSTLPSIGEVLGVQPIGTDEQAEALLDRLRTLPDALTAWRGVLERGLDHGHLVAQRQARSVARQARRLTAVDGSITARIDELAEAHPDLAAPARATLPDIAAALHASADFLEEVYVPAAPAADAVGPERYGRDARRMLGLDLDVDDTITWAWERIGELTDRAGRLAADIDPAASLGEVFEALRTDPAYAAPSRETFRELMLERQLTALEHLDGRLFDVPEQLRTVEVRLEPPGGALGASYVAPSEDLTRPGLLQWSLGDAERVPLFEEVSTAYHEGFPGHHLQIGLQVMMADRLSRAHRLLVWPPGYGEGWALYAETLMDELGALEEPMYELGYVSSMLLRLVRVVVDTGLHLQRAIPDDAPFHPGESWTPALAQRALQHLAALPEAYAASEVDRYLGWPAQAITYAVGERVILDLRAQRRTRDGEAFDLKRFHHDVLGSGPVGLDHLRSLVLGDADQPDVGSMP